MSNITRAERLADKLLADAWSENGAVQFTTSMLCVSELRRLAESERALLEALEDLVDAVTGRIEGEVVALHNALVVIAKTKEARNA